MRAAAIFTLAGLVWLAALCLLQRFLHPPEDILRVLPLLTNPPPLPN